MKIRYQRHARETKRINTVALPVYFRLTIGNPSFLLVDTSARFFCNASVLPLLVDASVARLPLSRVYNKKRRKVVFDNFIA